MMLFDRRPTATDCGITLLVLYICFNLVFLSPFYSLKVDKPKKKKKPPLPPLWPKRDGRYRERACEAVLVFLCIFLPSILLLLLTDLLFLCIHSPPVHVSTLTTCLSLAYGGHNHVDCPTEKYPVPGGEGPSSADTHSRRQRPQQNSVDISFKYALYLFLRASFQVGAFDSIT